MRLAPRRRRVLVEPAFVPLQLSRALGQRVPRADHRGGGGEVHALLRVTGHRLGGDVLVHRHHQHAVVREQTLIDGFAKSQPVELRAVDGFIVHRGDLCRVLFCFGFHGVVEKPRRRGHVQPARGLDVVRVVDAHEVGLVRAREGDAGGAVGLVADDEVEVVKTLFLRVVHGGQRLVGGEDDAQAAAALAVLEAIRDVLAVRGDGHLEVVRGDVFCLAAGLVVGADGEALQVEAGLRGPLAQRLGEQRDGGDEEQHAGATAVLLRHLLGEAQRGERLAGAAGHDEFAAVVAVEPGHDAVDRLLLVRARLERLAPGEAHLHLGAGEDHVPVHRRLSDLAVADAAGRDLLVLQRLLRVLRPLVGGGDDVAVDEVFHLRFRLERVAGRLEERVDVLLLNASGRLVELRLDGDPFAVVTLTRNEVDAGVGLAAVVAPLVPALYLVELGGEYRVCLEEVDHQLLKRDPVLALRLVLTELVEGFAE